MLVTTNDKFKYLEGLSSIGDHSVGVVKGYIHEERIKNDFRDMNLVLVKSISDGLERTSEGKLDVMVGSLFVVINEIQKKQLSNLKITGHTRYKHKLSIGVRNDDPQLLKAFDLYVRSITSKEHGDVQRNWTTTRFEHGVDYDLLWKVIAGAVALLLVALWWMRKLKRLNDKIHRMSITDEMTGLYNRVSF